MADTARILEAIARCDDPDLLRQWWENAKRSGELEVAEAAFRRLIAILPADRPGTVEHEFWAMIHAFEQILSSERGRTTRLSRTRQKVARDGVAKTLADWACDRHVTDGFRMLLDRGIPELTGEAIVLRHAREFPQDVVAAARRRLLDAGVDVERVLEGFGAV
jgi:hypothetical protein